MTFSGQMADKYGEGEMFKTYEEAMKITNASESSEKAKFGNDDAYKNAKNIYAEIYVANEKEKS